MKGKGGVQEARRRNATSHSKNELYLIKKGATNDTVMRLHN